MFDRFLSGGRQRNQLEAAINVDFTGGLVDTGEIAPVADTSTVRDILNLDILPAGGVQRRQTVQLVHKFGDDFSSADQVRVVRYEQSDRVSYFLALAWNGSTAYDLYEVEMTATPSVTNHGNALGTAERLLGVQVGGLVYLNRSAGSNWRTYDGTTFTLIGSLLVNTGAIDFSVYSQTGVPSARDAVVWDGRVWLSAPRISGTEQPNQVSFSWPFGAAANEGPQDYHEDLAYRFQAAGHEADSVIGMAPANSRMYVFLRRSVHVLAPYFGEPSTLYYTNTQVTNDVGCVGRNAFAEDGGGVWFFDQSRGLMHITPDGTLSNPMEKIKGVMDDLEDSLIDGVAVGLVNDRVWVSVPEFGEARNNVTYIYDPRIDAWTKHSVGFHSFWDHRPVGDSGEYPATNLALSWAPDDDTVTLVELESAINSDENTPYDYLSDTVGETQTEVDSYLETAWFDADFPEVVKDWRGVEFLFSTQPDQTMDVTAYRDYDGAFDAAYWEVEAENPAVYEGSVPIYPEYNEVSADDIWTGEVTFTATTMQRTDGEHWLEADGWKAGNRFTLTGTNAGTYNVTSISTDTITASAAAWTVATEDVTATPLTRRPGSANNDEGEYRFGVSAVGITSGVPLPEPVRVRRSLQGRAISFRIEPQAESVPSPYTGTTKKFWGLNRFTVFFSRKELRA